MIDAPLGDRSKWKPKWPDLGEYVIPFGQAKVLQEGDGVTLVTYGRHVLLAKEAIAKVEHPEAVELIDLRSLYPYDWHTIRESVLKTMRVLFLNEDSEVTNFGEHLAYRVSQELFYHIYAPPRVLAGQNVPGIGLHPALEDASVPQVEDIVHAVHELLSQEP